MKSVEDEFEEIKSGWDLKYLDDTGDYLYLVELKKEEVTLKLYIPDGYPNTAPEFGEKEMKILEEKMPGVLQLTQRTISENLGKPMIALLLENIMKHVKAVPLEKEEKIPDGNEKICKSPQKRQKRKKAKYKLACSWGMVGSNQKLQNIPDESTKLGAKSSLNRNIPSQISANRTEKTLHSAPMVKEKAPPMKTAKDVINRLKWDDKLKKETFIVGYEDRFDGIIEVPVFDLNWQDDIASTGPADQLAIPEHRVQYFKYNSAKVWEKATRTDRIFGSTGSKADIMKLIQKAKECQHQMKVDPQGMVTVASDRTKVEQSVSAQVADEKDIVNMVSNEVTESDISDRVKVETTVLGEGTGAVAHQTASEPGTNVTANTLQDEHSDPSVDAETSNEPKTGMTLDIEKTVDHAPFDPEDQFRKYSESDDVAQSNTELNGETPPMKTAKDVISRTDPPEAVTVEADVTVAEQSVAGEVNGSTQVLVGNDSVETLSKKLPEFHVTDRVSEWIGEKVTNTISEVVIDMMKDKTGNEVHKENTSDAPAEPSSGPLHIDETTVHGEGTDTIFDEPDDALTLDDSKYGLPDGGTKNELKTSATLDTEKAEDQLPFDLFSDYSESDAIKEVMETLILRVEGLDIHNNEANPKEAAGEKRKHGYGDHGHHGREDYRGHYDHRGWGNKRQRRDERRGRGWRERDGVRREYSQSDRYWSPDPPNYCLCGSFDESSQPKLSELLAKLGDTLKNMPFYLSPEPFYVNIVSLRLESKKEAEEFIESMQHVCSTWSPCIADVEKVFCDGGIVSVPPWSRSFKPLLWKIQKERGVDLHSYGLHPKMKVAVLRDEKDNHRRATFKLKPKLFPFVISELFIQKISESDFDDEMLLNKKFALLGKPRHHSADHKGYDSRHQRLEYEPARIGPHFRQREVVKDQNWEIKISKTLSAILRHQAMGFKLDQEGFVKVNDLLSHSFFERNEVEERDIKFIVETNAKKRFYLDGQTGSFKIRANQGHTVQVEELDLKKISDPRRFPKVVHGTKMEFWHSIRKTGLQRMRRNHIHMTTSEPNSSEEVISGMRNSSSCFIYIDIAKAMKDGIQFFESQNGVILSEGVDGVLDRKYFSHASGITKGGRINLLIDEERDESSIARKKHHDEDAPCTSSHE